MVPSTSYGSGEQLIDRGGGVREIVEPSNQTTISLSLNVKASRIYLWNYLWISV